MTPCLPLTATPGQTPGTCHAPWRVGTSLRRRLAWSSTDTSLWGRVGSGVPWPAPLCPVFLPGEAPSTAASISASSHGTWYTGEAGAGQGSASASEARLGAGPPGTALRAYGPAGAPGGPAPPLLTLLPDRVTRGPGNSQAGTSEAGTQGSLDTTGQLTAACEAHDPGSATFQGFGHPGLEVGTGAVGSGRARGRCQALPGGPPHQVVGFCPSPGLGQPPSRSTEVGSCGA